MRQGIAAVDGNFWPEPNLRPFSEALTAALREKEGQPLQHIAAGVSSSNAKGVPMLLVHSPGLTNVSLCVKGLLLLMAISARSQICDPTLRP